MKDWLKKNRDAIVITAVGIGATALVAAVTYKITTDQVAAITRQGNMQMSMVADGAGVLDKIIEHQNNLIGIHKQ
jgi:hypothetical protein